MQEIDQGIPPACEMTVLESLAWRESPAVARLLLEQEKATRLPPCIVAVAVDKLVDSAEIVVLDRRTNLSDWTHHDRMLVDLHIERSPRVFLDPLVEAVTGPE